MKSKFKSISLSCCLLLFINSYAGVNLLLTFTNNYSKEVKVDLNSGGDICWYSNDNQDKDSRKDHFYLQQWDTSTFYYKNNTQVYPSLQNHLSNQAHAMDETVILPPGKNWTAIGEASARIFKCKDRDSLKIFTITVNGLVHHLYALDPAGSSWVIKDQSTNKVWSDSNSPFLLISNALDPLLVGMNIDINAQGEINFYYMPRPLWCIVNEYMLAVICKYISSDDRTMVNLANTYPFPTDEKNFNLASVK